MGAVSRGGLLASVGGLSVSRGAPAAATLRGAWSPAALGSKLILWWDAEDLSSLTLAGSAVTDWTDKSAGHQVSQPTSGFRPVWNATAVNGRPGVVFDGMDDTLSNAVSAPSKAPVSIAREFWTLVAPGALPSTNQFFFRQGAWATDARRLVSLGSNLVTYARMGAGRGSGGDYAVELPDGFGSLAVLRWTVAQNSISISKNGGSAAVGNSATSFDLTTAPVHIGSVNGVSQHFPGAINTIIQTEPLTAAEAAQLLAYLKSRGGIV